MFHPIDIGLGTFLYTMTDADDIYHVAGRLSKVKVTLVYKFFVSDQKS